MDISNTPSLSHIKTLSCPSGKTRAWQSNSHPSASTPLLATASSDRSVAIWSLRDFTLLSTITGGHKRSVRTVQWKDFGKTKTSRPPTLATGSFDANVGIWVRNEDKSNEDNDEREIDVDGDDAGEDWHFSSLLTGPDSEIKSVAFSPPHYSTNLLATSSRDKSVWVWEEVEVDDEDNEWETIAVLGDHTGDVKCVAWCTGYQKPSSPDSNENQIIGYREVLASGSYDDTIRLWRDVESEGDWTCVAVIDGHKGTVWDLSWESYLNYTLLQSLTPNSTPQSIEETWEPRLVSCSDDMSVRIWRRELSEAELEKRRNNAANPLSSIARLPSTIRPPSAMETWVEDSRLPEIHVRSIYAVDWSRQTGLIVTCGGDGAIVVYQEVIADADADVAMNGTDDKKSPATKWIVVALLEAAHDEFEINHVCWAARRDPAARFPGEEVIVSTGDDGDVRIWALPESLISK